jgi:hypothetical protein
LQTAAGVRPIYDPTPSCDDAQSIKRAFLLAARETSDDKRKAFLESNSGATLTPEEHTF